MTDYRPITEEDKQGQPQMLAVRISVEHPAGGFTDSFKIDDQPAIWRDNAWRRGNGRIVEHDDEDILGIA